MPFYLLFYWWYDIVVLIIMIKKLNYTKLHDIYKKYMTIDFPKEELKPYSMIKNYVKNNDGIALGYYDDNNKCLLGYATALFADKVVLLDYFAILPEFRNKGLGTSFIDELSKFFSDYKLLLIEAETPDNIIAKKRIDFYKKCGCIDSNIKGYLYFVDYILMYKELSDIDSINIKETILKTYNILYPKLINTKYLVFH